MKIFTAAQIRACDAFTIHASGISSIDLMEKAALACHDWIRENLPADALFVILCGSGNNGGDGLAIARLLHQSGVRVKAFLLQVQDELSPDCSANLQKLLAIDKDLVTIVTPGTFIAELPPHILLIDAILGTGLNRPVSGWLADFITHINSLPNRKIAIDMPSGLPADIVPDNDAVILQVQDTLSFHFYKRSFLHPECGAVAGRISLLNIGLNPAFIEATHSQYRMITPHAAKTIYKPRTRFSHKGTYGSVLMVGGSYGKIGAMVLSSMAALRAGAGLVTALVPSCGYQVLQTAIPEVMCITSGENNVTQVDRWEHIDAVGIGPGMGTDSHTANAVAEFLESCKQPVVLDADALNIIAKQPELLAKIPKGSIITPHPKEFSRLFGSNTNSMIQVDHARIQAMRYNINIVLKGHHTAVINTEGECWYNMTGNAGMATAGSGDVLTGLITGLLAQGYEPHAAAMLGVYLHGVAGDLAADETSKEALIASDIVAHIGQAFKKLTPA